MDNNRLKIIPVLMIFFVLPVFSQNNIIEAEGIGMSEDAAIESAKRSAVEQGVGTVLSSETVVKNSVLFSDNIFAKSQGYVKSFEVIDKYQNPDGVWSVTIKAEITEILDEILKDELAVQTLLNAMNRPRIVFLVREENLIDNTHTDFAETKLVSMFYDKGFDVVDRQLVATLKGNSEYESALAGDVTAATKIAGQLGADIIVIGTAKISSGGKVYNMYSGQADINGKIVRTDTGEILAIVPLAHGKKPHISLSTAGINAVNEASEKIGNEIIGQLIKKWSTQQANAANIFIVLTEADFMSYMNYGVYLKSKTVPGIRNAFEKSFLDGVAEYQVLYEGKSQDLAMMLMQYPSKTVGIEITGLSGNRISAKVVLE